MRQGVRLGVDVGTVRVGLATCDAAGVLATPLETVPRPAGERRSDLDRIAEIVRDRDVVAVVVGLPRSLSGAEGAAAGAARTYAAGIAARVHPVPVRLVDERFSTVSAQRSLRAAGMKGRKQRRVIDQQAAVTILQDALDEERTTGRPAGIAVAVPAPPAAAGDRADEPVERSQPDRHDLEGRHR